MDKSEEALTIAEQARDLLWARSKELGLVVDSQNLNSATQAHVWEDRKRVSEEDVEAAGGGAT